MTDLHALAHTHRDLPEKEQRKAGKAIKGEMDDEHARFLTTVMKMLDSGKISSREPQSMVKKETYDTLPQEWKDKTDLALLNIADQVRLIEEFYRSKDTPDASPHLQTMIEQLWQMKQRIEETHDVFKF